MKEKTEFGTMERIHHSELGSCVIETVEPGKEIRRHYHEGAAEVACVLEGEASGWKTGQVSTFREKEPHGFRNDSKKPLKLALIMVPPYDPKDVHFTD